MSRPVVVGVDGTVDALRAVRWAAGHAGLRDTGLRLVHAASSRERAEGVLRDARDVVAEVAAGLPVTVVIGEIPAAELLVRESAHASLVVLGGPGHGGFSGLLTGTTALTVAGHGRCPLVVMGGPEDAGNGPVVVGLDGTATSDAALDFALREASLRGTGLIAVHGLTTPGVKDTVLDRDHAHAMIAERIATRQADHPDVKVVEEVVLDTPGRALLGHATSAQLAVVGSRRRLGHRGLLLRSTGQYLLHQAPCPVAVVRCEHRV